MNSYLLSILLPIYTNWKEVSNIIKNITENTHNTEDVEIILTFLEKNVEEYISHIDELLDLTPHIKILIKEENEEDTPTHTHIYNQTQIADGEFLLFLNNGISFNGKSIDLIMNKYRGKLCIVDGVGNSSFESPPIVNSQIFQILGVQSLFHFMCSPLGIEIKEPNISFNYDGSSLTIYNLEDRREQLINGLKSYISELEWSRDWLPLTK
jgi:hypothetical protein